MEPAARRAQFAADSHAVAIAADDVGGFLVDVVFECSGSAAAIVSALKLLAPGGILVVVGAGPEPALDSATILLKEITVRGSYIYNDEFDRAIELLANQQIAVAELTTVISPLPDALAAFDAARRRNHESAHCAGHLGSGGRRALFDATPPGAARCR
jgi:threonine dehydrogenase-like Zn-dependent dehydrogenase